MPDLEIFTIPVPKIIKSWEKVIGDAGVTFVAPPIDIQQSYSGTRFIMTFEDENIGTIAVQNTWRDNEITARARFNDKVPSSVQAAIVRKLEAASVRITAALNEQVVDERNVIEDMQNILGPIDHPKVKAPTPFGWRHLNALTYPGVLHHLIGDEFLLRRNGMDPSGNQMYLMEYVRDSVSYSAMRMCVKDTVEIWGRGDRERARYSFGLGLLESGLALCQKITTDPVLAAEAESIRAITYAQIKAAQGVNAENKDLVLGCLRDGFAAEHAGKILNRRVDRDSGFPNTNVYNEADTLAFEKALTCDLGEHLAAHIVRRHNHADDMFVHITFKGVPIYDHRDGFMPGVSSDMRPGLFISAIYALANADPVFAKEISWRPEFTTEVLDPQEAFKQKMLRAFNIKEQDMEI